MNPRTYADGLKARNGSAGALRIAEECVAITMTLVTDTQAVPAYNDEIEFGMGDDTKDKVRIDEGAKAKRVKSTAIFWQNVLGNLRGRNKSKG